MAAMSESLTIDVISDVVCPWCFVGKRRLGRALAMLPEVNAVVRWLPFRLDPTIPPGGIARADYLSKKFGSVEAAAPMYEQLTELAPAEGISFHFDRITRSPNTVDAHRLIRWAQQDGDADDMVERLFVAYFSEGEDVGDAAVLTRIAGEAGMDAATVGARLIGDEDREATVAEVENAYRIGITGVPSLILQNRLVVVGAQAPEIIVEAIGQALEGEPGAG